MQEKSENVWVPIFYRERFESHLWRLEGPGTDILAITHFEFDHKILGL